MAEYVVMIETYATAWVLVRAKEGDGRVDIMRQALADESQHPTLCVGCTGGGGAPWDELELCDSWKPFLNHQGKWEIERAD